MLQLHFSDAHIPMLELKCGMHVPSRCYFIMQSLRTPNHMIYVATCPVTNGYDIKCHLMCQCGRWATAEYFKEICIRCCV